MRYKTKLHVDLQLFGKNVELLKSLAPKNKIIFMVKANAYGHGMVPLVRFAVTELGLSEFGCASLGEAVKLREDLPELEYELFVFSDTQLSIHECAEIYLNKRIQPVVADLETLRLFLENPAFRFFPLSLKFNTGMNRLGFPISDLPLVIELLKKHGRKEIHHLFSHFATSSNIISSGDQTSLQYDCFLKIKNELISSGISIHNSSIANSGAIEQGFALEETHIRPGLMLYGPSSLDAGCEKWKASTISRLETYIIRTFKVDKGEPLGYGAHKAETEGLIALLALGYGDGIANSLSGATVSFEGLEGKIFGRVNMDMTQVFFKNSALVEKLVMPSRPVMIWSHERESLARLAREGKQIPYEIFCRISSRIPRVYGVK